MFYVNIGERDGAMASYIISYEKILTLLHQAKNGTREDTALKSAIHCESRMINKRFVIKIILLFTVFIQCSK